MRKLFLITTFVLFSISGAYAHHAGDEFAKRKDVPQEILNMIDEMEEEIGSTEDGVTLRSVQCEGKNVVMIMEIDEGQLFAGMSFIEAFEIAGYNMQDLAEEIRADMLSDAEGCAVLRKYKYNVVMRMVGSVTKASKDIVISYKDLK